MKPSRAAGSVVSMLTAFFILAGVFAIRAQPVHAYSSTNVGSDKVYKSGSFKVSIRDADRADSNLTVNVSKSTAPSWDDMCNKSTTWNVSLSGSNNHSVSLTSGQVTTKKDNEGDYFVLSIGLRYTLPAHSRYVSGSVDTKHPSNCRMNFEEYKQFNGGENTAARATHSTGAKTVTLNLQVNTACASVRTHEKRRYSGSTMAFSIARPSYTLSTQHLAQGFGSPIILRPLAAAGTYACCSDLNLDAYATSAPRGYRSSPAGWMNLLTSNKSATLYYTPIHYSLSYHLSGGTNHPANPGSYTVCNPVSFGTPTRAGYQFVGWYEGNSRITGINLGIDNSGLSADNFYSRMAGRTIGNKSITAKWNRPPEITAPVADNRDGNAVTPFLKKMGGRDTLIIQKGDRFTARNYQTALDEEDGDLTEKVQVQQDLPLEQGRATKSGTYEVVYQVTDSGSITVTKTIAVLVNDPPKPLVEERYFFKGQKITNSDLLAQVRMEDKEDGTRKPVHNRVLSVNGDPQKTSLDTSKEGISKIKCRIEDSLKGTGEEEFLVTVVEDIQETNSKTNKYPRYIDGESISSLGPDSIWMTNAEYNGSLAASLRRDSPVMHYELEQ